MEHPQDARKNATLYLDVDGVILPYFAQLSETDYSATPNGELDREWIDRHEFYHPEVVRALGEVAARSLVVLSSSRALSFIHEPVYAGLVEKLQVQGALVIDALKPGLARHKAEAVRRHWTGVGDRGLEDDLLARGRGKVFSYYGELIEPQGDRAVWTDDDAMGVTLRASRQLEELHQVGVSTFVPNCATGLTLADVEEIGRRLQGYG